MSLLLLMVIQIYLLFIKGTYMMENRNKTVLNVGLLLEMTEYRYRNYVKLVPYILNYAFTEIQENQHLLSDYKFNMILKDTKVSHYFIDMLGQPEPT